MSLPVLSSADQHIIEALYAEQVLREAKLDVDLAETLLVTETTHPNPAVSQFVDVAPKQVILHPYGGCGLHSISSAASHEERRDLLLHRVKRALLKHDINEIVLVASVPNQRCSVVDVIDQLRSAEEFLRLAVGNKRSIHNFLCVEFADGSSFTMQVNTPAFHAWYNRYEQEVLGVRNDAFQDDDPEDTIDGRSGMTVP